MRSTAHFNEMRPSPFAWAVVSKQLLALPNDINGGIPTMDLEDEEISLGE